MAKIDLFSERFRLLKILFAIIPVFFCCLYSHRLGEGMESRVFLPVTRGDDDELRVLSYFKVDALTAAGILVRDKDTRIFAAGKFENAKPGDTISIVGIRDGNIMKMTRYHIHRGRFLKKTLSLLAFLILSAITFRYFSFDRKTFSIVERETLR